MTGDLHYTIDPNRVVHETIDGETILIDLETGTYYSLTGSGSEIWALLLAGHSQAGAVAEMAHRYASDPQPVTDLTTALIERLTATGLLSETAGPAPGPAPPPPAREGFAAPVLEAFTDMQQFLVLDPIHEVQDSGWPHALAPPAGDGG